ncbi:MAG: phosphotransferase family protein [Nocardioides sp.]|uniref:phosphotransferase family protein n=1 Tax=Nocardioides sp. TaxID=35761 RepID=UPI0039E64162
MAGPQVDDELLASLGKRVADQVSEWRPGASVIDLRPLAGGTSSLAFTLEISDVSPRESPLVLKVAPPGLEPVRNRDVLRQARLLSALHEQSPGLAPEVFFTDAGEPPEVPPFLAMNLVEGECLEPILVPVDQRPSPQVARSRGLAAARNLAFLHSIAPADLGLSEEPVVTLASEIERWTRAFETLPPDLRGDFASVAGLLRDSMPAPVDPVVNHGDYRLGNLLCGGEEVNAIIDWEIWSVGDPRIDVTWLLFFADDGGHPAAEPGPPVGTPSGAELIDVYESERGVELGDLSWFTALSKYKEAGLTGLLLKRADKNGTAMKPALARMRPELPRLLREAALLLEG